MLCWVRVLVNSVVIICDLVWCFCCLLLLLIGWCSLMVALVLLWLSVVFTLGVLGLYLLDCWCYAFVLVLVCVNVFRLCLPLCVWVV